MKVIEAWHHALKKIQQEGIAFTDDEKRTCYEVENMTVRVDDLSDVKKPLQWLRTQSDWYYPTDQELQKMLFGNIEEDLLYSYGSRLFRFQKEINQLDGYIIPLLKENPNSRRAIAILADPLIDELPQQNFISLLSVWFRIVNNKLCLSAVIRSSDFVLGWPANIYQAHLLQQYVAQKLNVSAGSITTISLSAHYFANENWLLERIFRNEENK